VNNKHTVNSGLFIFVAYQPRVSAAVFLNLYLSFTFAVTISESALYCCAVVAGIRGEDSRKARFSAAAFPPRRLAHAERRGRGDREIALSIGGFAIAPDSPRWERISRAIPWIHVARSTERDNTAPNRVIKMRTLDEKLTVRERGLQLESTRPERENV